MADNNRIGRVSVDVAANANFTKTQIQAAVNEAVKGGSRPITARVNASFTNRQLQAALTTAASTKPLIVPVQAVFKDSAASRRSILASQASLQKQLAANQAKLDQTTAAQRQRLLDRSNVQAQNAQQRAAIQAQGIEARKQATLTSIAERGEQTRRNILLREQLRQERSGGALRSAIAAGDRFSSSLRDLDQTTTRALRTSLTAFTVWSTGVVTAFGAVSAAAITNFARIEEASVRAGAVFTSDQFAKQLERTGKGFDDFGKRAQSAAKVVRDASNEIALETIFNPAEIAAGAQAFAQAGLSQEETLRKQADGFSNLGIATRFAQNEQLDIADATEKLTGGLNAAGLATSDLTSLTDKFTAAANATNATASQIADAFSNQAAGAFRAYGQSVDSTIATISLFAKANLRGLEAGTQSAIVLREITNAITNKAPEAFEKFGIAIEDAQGKALPFEQTLVQFASALQNVQENEGAAGVARFRKELGLTERSLRGLIILTPQLQELGSKGVAALAENSANSLGATARQAEALTETISVQFGNFVEGIGIQLQKIGEKSAPGFKDLIDQFNGSNGLFTRVGQRAESFGRQLGDVFTRVADFVQTPAFLNGVRTIAEAFSITLQGVGDAFKAFSSAFQDEGGKNVSTFEALANAVKGFSQLSATVLPVVAGFLGQIFDFLIDNRDAFKFFAVATLSLVGLRKAFTLIIRPLLTVTEVVGQFLARSGGLLGVLSRFGPIAAIVAGSITILVGAVRGVRDEFERTFGSNFRAKSDLDDLKVVIDALIESLSVLGRAVGEVFSIFASLGENIGRIFVRVLAEISAFVGDAGRLFTTGFEGFFRSLGDIIVNAITLPFRVAIAKVLDLAATAIEEVSKIKGVGSLLGDSADDIRDASAAVSDMRLDLSHAKREADSTAKSLGKVGKAQSKFIGPRLIQGPRLRPRSGAAKGAPSPATEIFDGGPSTSGGGVKSAAKEFIDLTQRAALAVARLRDTQRSALGASLIERISSAGAKGYKLTRLEAQLLERALPGVDKALERQRKVVDKLDESLNKLRNTQLLGTKAFSDAAFAQEQAIKQLQLQRLDLIIAGNAEESGPIVEIDKQIAALQQQAERANLAESLQLDPLRRKLEQTFNPTTELSFDAIVSQFRSLSAEREKQSAELTRNEQLQALLNTTLEATRARFADVDTVSRAAFDAQQKAAQAADSSSGSYSTLARTSGAAAKSIETVNTAAAEANTLGKTASANIGKGITSSSNLVASALNSLTRLITTRIAALGLTNSPLYIASRTTGFVTSIALLNGFRAGYLERVVPFARAVGVGIGTLIREGAPGMTAGGVFLMESFLTGLKQGFGTKEDVGSVAWYLNVFIPDWIKKNKGPVSYDATILVPAGEAVMDGFGRGLRSGFSQIQGFVKDVGPSLKEFISADAFSGRTAQVMADIAIGKKPDINGVFGDLTAALQPTFFGGASGPIDPSLSFLHPTLSLADTTKMAFAIVRSLGGGLNTGGPGQLGRPDGTITAAGNVSAHTVGTAADIGTGGGSPTAASLRLFEYAKTQLGSIFRQVIHNGRGFNAGGGSFGDSQHFDHVHLEWIKGLGFNENSGKIGTSPALRTILGPPAPGSVVDIPGASSVVDKAISAAAARHKIEVALLAALYKQESSFNPNVISRDGGYGLAQLTSPGLLAKVGFNRLDPFKNADVGAEYLKSLLNQFRSIPNAIGAYNAGPGAVGNFPASTRNHHIPNVLRYYEEFRRLFGGNRFGGFREHGGGVQTNRSYVVGERGPEIFRPGSTGRIISNREINNSSTGGSYVDNSQINVTTNATDPRAVAAIIDANKRRGLQGLNLG